MPIHSTTLACDGGWIHHQHPMKPLGVIMHSTPCPVCQPDKASATVVLPATFTADGDPIINQCDGCRRGLPKDNQGVHHGPGPYDLIGCTAESYGERR